MICWERMQIHYLGRQICRCQRNILAVCAVLLCALLLPLFVQRRYFENYVLGPLPLSASDLPGIAKAESLSRYFVALRGTALAETGLAEIDVRRNRTSNEVEERTLRSEILLLRIGERYLAIKVPPGQRGSEWQGGLHTLDRDLSQRLLSASALADDRPGLWPVYLDATGFRSPGHVALALILPALSVVLWVMARAAGRYRNLRTHPLRKKIERYGDPESVLLQIDAEAQAAGGHIETGLTLVTASYLIFGGEFRVEIVRFADIVWAHAELFEQQKLGITVRREHSLCVYEKSGDQISLPAPGRTPRGLLKIIQERAPGAIIGHHPEVAKMWAHDRGRLLAQVEATARRASETAAAHAADRRPR